MKIFVYNVRPDEVSFIKEWQTNHPDVEVATTQDFFTVDTIDKAAGYTGISALQTIPYPRELFKKMAAMHITFLALRNVGVDNLDLQAASDYGIKISNVPAYSPYAIAEFSVTQVLNLLRRTKYIDRQQLAGDFHWSPDFMGHELRKQTVGVIGTGRIGRHAMAIYQAFGASLMAYDPTIEAGDHDGVTYVATPEEIFKVADVITLHAPAVKSNFHLINATTLKMMKPTAIIVNTARGALIDLDALQKALANHEIAGAALDAFENETAAMQQFDTTEKLTDPQLIALGKLPNVLLSPHMAFHTDVAVTNMVNGSLNSLLEFGRQNQSEFQVG